jgi:hypothetical protein
LIRYDLNEPTKNLDPMKKTAYFFLLVIAAMFTITPAGFASKDKDQKATLSITAVKAENTTARESAWLNKKNFPNLQDSACPFSPVKPGC